jgi:hypothetical protein
MKNFIRENWFKMVLGSSMLMASFGFMIYAISPAYSNSESNKIEHKSNQNVALKFNGAQYSDGAVFVDGGYAYRYRGSNASESQFSFNWSKTKLQ